MNLAELQAELRHFAAERDWQPFHTPKNLSTALMVEAAELAEIFQWMTPEESQSAQQDPATKERIGEEVADVLLYLLQLADHSQVDIAQAVRHKLVRNAAKYPAKRTIERASPVRAAVPVTHVLLDYENVQPTQDEVRAMVPDASQLWVFHGPNQRQVEQRFASFGAGVTAVPISKTGKNALDFLLSFQMGCIASRHQASKIVVVANDKGYGPMLEHAKAMGFAVRQLGHGGAKVPAKKAAAKKAAAKKSAPAKKVVAKSGNVPAAKKVAVGGLGGVAAVPGPPPPPPSSSPARPSSVSAELLEKITVNLRKMGDKRPVKAASLRRALKSFLGAEPGDDLIEVALGNLMAAGVVALGAKSDVSYPGFAVEVGEVNESKLAVDS